MPEILKFAKYEVAVIRSKRRKSVAVKVDLDGVSVRVPESLPLSDIRALVWEKSHWIEAKLKRAAEKRQAVAAAAEKSARLGQGSPVLYQGRQLTLTLQQAEQTRIYQQAHELIVEAPGAMSGEPDQLRAIVEQWLYARAVEELHLCVNVYKQRVGAIPSRVEVKSYKARWGSCKPDQSIQLNWRLIHAPMHIMDYVVVHELCHLLEMNHGPRFWSQVERVDPQYRMKRRWLQDNGWQLTV
jgi:predicted metal-dependent hydrolase